MYGSINSLSTLHFFLAANVVKYSFTKEGDGSTIVKLVRVHQKNLRQLLRHILLVRLSEIGLSQRNCCRKPKQVSKVMTVTYQLL
jgi:hypothetical protein